MRPASFVVHLHHPGGEQWRELTHHPYVAQAAQTLSLPTSHVVLTLKEHITREQADELAGLLQSRITGGSVTVEFAEAAP